MRRGQSGHLSTPLVVSWRGPTRRPLEVARVVKSVRETSSRLPVVRPRSGVCPYCCAFNADWPIRPHLAKVFEAIHSDFPLYLPAKAGGRYLVCPICWNPCSSIASNSCKDHYAIARFPHAIITPCGCPCLLEPLPWQRLKELQSPLCNPTPFACLLTVV